MNREEELFQNLPEEEIPREEEEIDQVVQEFEKSALPEIPGEKEPKELEELDKKVEALFEVKTDKIAEARDFGKALFRTIKVIKQEMREGKGTIKATLPETFEKGRVKELTRDGHFYLIPKGEEGSEVIVLSDCHGRIKALKQGIKKFLTNPESYLGITGDLIAGFGEEEYRAVKAFLKLKSNPEYSKRVAMTRGNCEVDVWPSESVKDNMLYRKLGFRADRVFRRKGLGPLFRGLLPTAVVTESGGVLVHGLLSKSEKPGEKNLTLEQINTCANYEGRPDQEPFGSWKDGSRTVYRMLEGSLPPAVKGKIVEQSYAETLEAMNTIQANFLTRGHQTPVGNKSYAIEQEGRITTFNSGEYADKGGDAILIIPNDKEVEKIDREMIEIV